MEDIGAKQNAGLVQSNQAKIDLDGTRVPALEYARGYLNTERYGMVLSSASD